MYCRTRGLAANVVLAVLTMTGTMRIIGGLVLMRITGFMVRHVIVVHVRRPTGMRGHGRRRVHRAGGIHHAHAGMALHGHAKGQEPHDEWTHDAHLV